MTFGLWGRPQLGELQTEGHRCCASPRLSAELGNPGPLDGLPSCPSGNPPHPHTNFDCAWKLFILPSLFPKPAATTLPSSHKGHTSSLPPTSALPISTPNPDRRGLSQTDPSSSPHFPHFLTWGLMRQVISPP